MVFQAKLIKIKTNLRGTMRVDVEGVDKSFQVHIRRIDIDGTNLIITTPAPGRGIEIEPNLLFRNTINLDLIQKESGKMFDIYGIMILS